MDSVSAFSSTTIVRSTSARGRVISLTLSALFPLFDLDFEFLEQFPQSSPAEVELRPVAQGKHWFWRCQCLRDESIFLMQYLDHGDQLFLQKVTAILETINIDPTMNEDLIVILIPKLSQLPPNSLDWNLILDIADKIGSASKPSIWKMFIMILKKGSATIDQPTYSNILQRLNN
jgi:hypothetical protein